MSYPDQSALSETPSRPSSRQPLSIRTSTTPNQSASPAQQQSQPYPTYPLPIPPEKFDRAVVLFGRLRLEEGLQQREQQRHSQSHLRPIQQLGKSHSVASHTSSGQHSPSGVLSNYGATTESVVSFDDKASPSSAAANPSSGLVAYDGSVVKPRVRRALSPIAKAKAALIRHLGSCWVCRSRRVPCPLDHIDIKALEEGLRLRNLKHKQPRERSATRETRSFSTPEPTQSGSRPSMASDITRSQSQRVPHSGSMAAQMDSLAYVGQQEALLQTPTNLAADPHSPIYPDPLSAIHQGSSFNYPTFSPMDLPVLENSYTSHQHGDMVQLGVNLGFGYQCRYLDFAGGCQEIFETVEELQNHFEGHFAFTRIEPPHRYRCSFCLNMTEYHPGNMCFACVSDGTVEHLIMGHFIRTETYQRYTPNGHDFFSGTNNDSDPFSASLFTMPGATGGMDSGMGNGDNGGMYQGGGYSYQQNSTYRNAGPASGPQGGDFNGYNAGQQERFQFHGSESGEAIDMESSAISWRSKALHTLRRHKTILVSTTLLFTIALAVETHTFFVAKARNTLLHPKLPCVGFLVALASFTISHVYRHIKYPPTTHAPSPITHARHLLLSHPLHPDTSQGSPTSMSKSALDLSSSALSSLNFRPAAPAPAFRTRIYL